MNKLLKPSSLLMYLLTLLVFDFIGMSIAGISGAAKGQGLAGGAIVFMYGIYTALIALGFAVIFCYYADNAKVVKANRILAVLLLVAIAVFTYRVYALKNSNDTFSKDLIYPAKTIAINYTAEISSEEDDTVTSIGLGFFKPELFKNPKLYFYSDPNLEKPVQDHSPLDSLVFKDLQQYNNYELVYAPPWLLPEHYKTEYDIFYFKLNSIGRDFAEVTLNKTTQQIGYVDRSAGEIIYWPEFLLRVHSVEFPPDKIQIIRFKPLDNAGEINVGYDFMKPVLIQDEWMSVELFDDAYQQVGKGWIRWRNGNKLLVDYSLLS